MDFIIYGDVYTCFSRISVNYLFQYIYEITLNNDVNFYGGS